MASGLTAVTVAGFLVLGCAASEPSNSPSCPFCTNPLTCVAVCVDGGSRPECVVSVDGVLHVGSSEGGIVESCAGF